MVEIKNLSLDYGEEHILDDISLSIAEESACYLQEKVEMVSHL